MGSPIVVHPRGCLRAQNTGLFNELSVGMPLARLAVRGQGIIHCYQPTGVAFELSDICAMLSGAHLGALGTGADSFPAP